MPGVKVHWGPLRELSQVASVFLNNAVLCLKRWWGRYTKSKTIIMGIGIHNILGSVEWLYELYL